MALVNLACLDANKARIATAGGIEAVVRVLEEHQANVGVMEQGCWALARVFEGQGKFEDALRYYNQAHEASVAAHGPDSFPVFALYNDMADVYNSQGKHDQALEYYQMSLDGLLATLGSDHPSVAAVQSNIGRVYHRQG